jgi:RNA polymerase sigma-70 factor (ECF subfamily)
VDDSVDGAEQFEEYRTAITAYCYRMLGSAFDADDAVQETFVRAWRNREALRSEKSLRSWIYGIATNACIDMLRARQRRAMPADLSAPTRFVDAALPRPLPESTWVEPFPDARMGLQDPADVAANRETVRLAFIAALQLLQPKQRAVLILRDVLAWQANEVADLLDMSEGAVTSSLQRARAAIEKASATEETVDPIVDDASLLDRYVTAFHAADVKGLLSVLRDDVSLTMPPHDLWLHGASDVTGWLLREDCNGKRLVPAGTANGFPAFGMYTRNTETGGWDAFAIHIIESDGDGISALHSFLEPKLFTIFDIPLTLTA